ncbi:DUF3427 domain-containing protein [Peptacetobacter sp.]|uniref:DUF3427 domain-containing protein n=1 Tax=Peptacetobacter sp. TaxID=2991975 RepID=UPI0026339F53|nr:DEAD/DEAH box helicase [Peptacetobacter sp.]
MLKDGIYEQIINDEINEEIKKSDKYIESANIDESESSKILTKYISDVIEKGLNNLNDKNNGINNQISLVNKIVNIIKDETKENYYEKLTLPKETEQLLSLYEKKNNILAFEKSSKDTKIIRPETSISQSSLFTGALHEPQMFTELKKEIISSDRIDMLVSFIKWSGLRLLIEELKNFTENGGKLRVITTSYMGATDIKAIEELNKLNNTEIKISYDTKRTRLHAKTYVFYRNSGFTTSYVGSSNMSNAALTSGLEWNVKVTKKDLPETIEKIEATFESYWNSNDFEIYDENKKEKLAKSLNSEKYLNSKSDNIYNMDIKPYSYQQEILDKLEAERKVRNHYRNLVVAATGTGKTVISALDYKRFKKENPEKTCRLLFVAHREEILKQSIYTFRSILKDSNFGDLFVGNHRPESIDNLFVSIQTFNSKEFTAKTSKDFYDYIVIDEFHHAAAPTYQNLLEYYKPSILLGLTATPERMDGQNVLKYFDNRVAAEIRLPEAIDKKLLCPFQYFGVTDNVDLDKLKWTTGGYDKNELSNVYTIDTKYAEKRADMIVKSTKKYVTDINDVKGIGFCVSIKHAEFMSEYFNKCGIKSMALSGKSSDDERKNAKDNLVSGKIKFIFVVDIYNEGVDIPEINTVLFLRPTESLTVFLQQLGRGLRLSDSKECLTVLDFIGQANKKYNFEEKFASLLSNPTKSVEQEIKRGFISVPKGCYIHLEKKARSYILQNIKASYGNKNSIANRISTFEEDSGKKLCLSNFLEYYNLDAKKIYKYKDTSFSRLCVIANKKKDFYEEGEWILSKSMYALSNIDSRKWIEFLIDLLENIDNINIKNLSSLEKRMFQMFYITIFGTAIENWNDSAVIENINLLSKSKNMLNEIIELLKYNYEKIDFIDEKVNLGFNCPLDLHCSYSRDQLLVAMDYLKVNSMRQGVVYVKEKNTDIFLITLNKSDKDYSPTTMYNDYSINEKLFHWQSQSTTSETSKTGQRYINHEKIGSSVLLFVREYKKDMNGKILPYTFLGSAKYVSHIGSRPMNIIWKLDKEIPAKYIKKTNKMII